MADQTHGAVDSLLGLLSNAIKDEARLLGGVQTDMQFIKDEMDSMNGFLLHLTKSKKAHNDQQRAWMKQVRDIAYIAQDCIELYTQDLTPSGSGLWASLRHLPLLLWTMPARHRLAIRIRELKVRVSEVGERRLRYGVTVPEDKNAPYKWSKPSRQDKRKGFLHALDTTPEPLDKVIDLLDFSDCCDVNCTIRSILSNHMLDLHVRKMFLCALHAYPHGIKQELTNLNDQLKEDGADVNKELILFCYGKLSMHYKCCLQYLTTFRVESSISRTILVRRWIVEGLVEKEDKTLKEAAELCFNELVFLRFVSPVACGPTGKVKSCKMAQQVRGFISDISQSENFVASLPIHLYRQLQIREIVLRQQKQQQERQQQQEPLPWWNICEPRAGGSGTTADSKDPLVELVHLLKSLPEEYRLNVLDLGGCKGLKKRHLKTICKVRSLKKLSLRETNVSRLPKQINNLRKLETLDVRQTDVHAGDTKHIFLPKLKHLLASRRDDPASPKVPSVLSTVKMPLHIRSMTELEILCHVQVSRGSDVLKDVGLLDKLRKLGVVLHGDDQDSVKKLLRAIGRLSDIRSLSICINHMPLTPTGEVNLHDHEGNGDATFRAPQNLESLSIKGKVAGLPDWIHNLTKLSKVTLCETLLPEEGSLQILGGLEGLRCLRLRRNSFPEATKLIFRKDKLRSFENLEFLLIEDGTMSSIHFESDDVAPKLKKIVLWRRYRTVITSDMVTGTENRHVLKVVVFSGCYTGTEGEGPARDITITETVE